MTPALAFVCTYNEADIIGWSVGFLRIFDRGFRPADLSKKGRFRHLGFSGGT